MVEHKGLDKESVKNMRVFISGSAQLTPNVFEKFEQMTGHRILERYGYLNLKNKKNILKIL